MEKKQTAMQEHIKWLEDAKTNNEMVVISIESVLLNATYLLSVEKSNIVEAYHMGISDCADIDLKDGCGDDYYNQTFSSLT